MNKILETRSICLEEVHVSWEDEIVLRSHAFFRMFIMKLNQVKAFDTKIDMI